MSEPQAERSFAPSLSGQEINRVFDDLDTDKDGFVKVQDLESKLNDIIAEASRNGRQPSWQQDLESCVIPEKSGQRPFVVRDLLPTHLEDGETVSRLEFFDYAKQWAVPHPPTVQSVPQQTPRWRRMRAYWTVHGPSIVFIICVILLQLGCGWWQIVKYEDSALSRAAFGDGIFIAKFCAGALYPTLMLMLLSMSRHFNTFFRRSYLLSRFINYDHSQKFHIAMAIVALLLGTTHGIAHLSGDLVHSSRPENQVYVDRYLGKNSWKLPPTYAEKMRILPVVTGFFALGMFWILALLSSPFIRKRNFEIFQLGHLLMYPIIAVLCAHGTEAILQKPILGYWLAFPALLVVVERTSRLVRGFKTGMATGKVLDGHVLVLTCKHPQGWNWKYRTGQYVLVLVPHLSRFQWHPFTVSSCRGNELEVHIKRSGDWTKKLMDTLPEDGKIRASVDGPFGAPAERFYDYDYSLVIANGIGVTPCSAILSDLEEKLGSSRDPWKERRSYSQLRLPIRSASRPTLMYAHKFKGSTSSSNSSASDLSTNDSVVEEEAESDNSWPATPMGGAVIPPREGIDSSSFFTNPSPFTSQPPSRSQSKVKIDCFRQPALRRPAVTRRVDIHWTVREVSNLAWFSGLLNRHIDKLHEYQSLDLRVNTYITTKWKDFASQIIANVIDRSRNPSALTGLNQPSNFGRPDFTEILERHYHDVTTKAAGSREIKVGVFYCGAPAVGETLSDLCRQFTARTRSKSVKITYSFHSEVFN